MHDKEDVVSNIVRKLASLSLVLCATSASAQDIAAVLATLDNTIAHANVTSQGLLSGDVNGAVDGAGQIATGLAAGLADSTPLEDVTSGLPTNIGNTPFFVQDAFRLVEFAASNPFADGSLPVPLLGLLIGDFSVVPLGDVLPLGGLQGNAQAGTLPGIELSALPLPAADLDPATLTALLGGASLPGL